MSFVCKGIIVTALLVVDGSRSNAIGEKARQSKHAENLNSNYTSVKHSRLFLVECGEYSKYVYVTENSPVMSATAERQSNNVSTCGIVETPLIVGGQRVNENEFPHMVNS